MRMYTLIIDFPAASPLLLFSSSPPQLRAPEISGHCRTSTASARYQWALPDLKPRAPDLSGHCRTSSASARSQKALPDLNRELRLSMGIAGPQPRASEKECQNSCQIDAKKNARLDARKNARMNAGKMPE